MPESVEELAERVKRIEDQLKGEPEEPPIDLRALPMSQLQNQLENDWLPQARSLLEPKSITADEIGELPSAMVSVASDDGIVAAQTIPPGLGVWTVFRDIEHDTADMVSLRGGYPTGIAAYTAIVCKVPGKYICFAGGATNAIAPFHINIAKGVAGGAAGSELAFTQENAAGVATGGNVFSLGRMIRMDVNDWIVCTVFNGAGGACAFGGWNQAREAYLGMTWVGA